MQRMVEHIKDSLKPSDDVIVINPFYDKETGGLSHAVDWFDDADENVKFGWVFMPQQGATKKTAKDAVRNLLSRHTLRVSITLPPTFAKISQASVSVCLLMFELRRPHEEEDVVKFIDATDDGYTRTGRKNQRTQTKDTGTGAQRYAEIQGIISGKLDKTELKFYTEESTTYAEESIETGEKAGSDWLCRDHIKLDITPTQEDFEKTVRDYLLWQFNTKLYQGIKRPPAK